MNGPGGPWAFWVEMKGSSTSIGKHQMAWAARTMAAGIPVFLLRGSRHVAELLEAVGYPHELERRAGSVTASGEDVELEYLGGGWRELPESEHERDAQKEVKRILRYHRFDVTDTSQGYRPGGRRHGTTRITRGTPDLWVTRPALNATEGVWEPEPLPVEQMRAL